MRFVLTEPAERDIRAILRETLQSFGTHQLSAYQNIISRGIEMVAENPARPDSMDRSELAEGVRLFHLELAAGRSGGAAHCLYYAIGTLPDCSQGVIILRVLHERMEPRHKVIRSLRGF